MTNICAYQKGNSLKVLHMGNFICPLDKQYENLRKRKSDSVSIVENAQMQKSYLMIPFQILVKVVVAFKIINALLVK